MKESTPQKAWFRLPFGHGYQLLAHAYRFPSQELSRANLPQVAVKTWASVAAVYQETSGNQRLLATAQRLCRSRLSPVVGWELAAVLLQALAVLLLGLVLQEAWGAPAWLGSADHAALRCVLLALLVAAARFADQSARHRRVKLAQQVAWALRCWLFHAAAAAATGTKTTKIAPEALDALVKRARPRLVAPLLGLALGAALLALALGPLAPAALALGALSGALEVFARRLDGRWAREAQLLRQHREAMSVTLLAVDMGCASSTVKLFSWERFAFQRLQSLRHKELAALSRRRMLAAARAAARWELVLPVAAAILKVSGVSLWHCFQGLAACRMMSQQLRQLLQIILTPMPQMDGEPEVPETRKAPKQGDRSSYKAARYAVDIEGMRFFWPNAGEAQTSSAPKPTGAAAMLSVVQKAQKGGNGLDLVDSVTDDASVAERAKRTTNQSNRFDLKVLSLQVKRGSHVALAGATGSGKSTLLAGLVGGCCMEHWGEDMEGGVELSGRLAYVPQTPQLLSASVRDNVLCGHSWDSRRYEQALMSSTLSEDLMRLPGGDASEMRELPDGGQAALQLARALYTEAQILLLDEPFARMDLDKAKRALQNLVKKHKDQTIILATQTLSILSPMDSIIVLRNGTVFEQGDYKTLSSMPTEFSRMLLIAREKEKRRKEKAKEGLSWPSLCYEVGPDPMRELYPMDEYFGTFPAFGSPSKEPKQWVPPKSDVPAPSATHVVGIAHTAESRLVPADEADPEVRHGDGGVTMALLAEQRMGLALPAAPVVPGDDHNLQERLSHRPPVRPGPEDGDAEDDALGQLLSGPQNWEKGALAYSAMPMVGASEAGGFGLGMDAELRGVDEVPEDQGIPMPHKSQLAAQDRVLPQPAATEQWTPEDPASPSAPNSPASGDGLRRRLPPAEDVEASLVPKQIWPEAEHTAPPPQTLGKPREEDRVKRRRGEREDSKGAGNGSNLPRDVLEKALKEKNEKIAELERQMALKGGEKKELLRDESGASLGGLPRSPPRGRGSSVLLLFGPASASWLLVVLVLCSAGAQVAAPVLLGLFFAPSLPSPSVAPTSAPSGVLSTSRAPAAPAPAPPAAPVPVPPTVPTFPPDAEIDDSEVVWLGFSTTTTTAVTTAVTTTEAATTTTTEAATPEQAWHVKLAGHFCHEPGLEQTSGPQGNYELDVTIGWHSAVPLTLATCQRACEDIADWGCRFISWGGPAAAAKWCYLHRQCGDVMRVPVYQVLEMNYTGSPQRLRRRLGSPRTAVSPLRGRTTSKLPRLARRSLRRLQAATEVEVASRWLSQYSLETALVALSLLLPLLGWYQARLAAYVGLQASRQSFSKQLRALLAAPADFRGAPLTFAPSTLEAKQLTERGHNILKDIADGDEFLPIPLVRCLSALSEVLGVVVCCAMASAGQAVPAVTLTLALGLAAYLHRLRLPFLHQIRRLQCYLEEAAVLRMQHLAECHEVLRAHGRLQSFCEDYEALCFDSARAVIAADAAERWLYTRLYCLIAVLLGFLSFPLLTQAAWPSELVFAAAGAAVAQVVWLPEAAVDLVKHGARLTHGLAALRRMRQLCKETEAEELESLILKLPETLKDEGESKGPEKMRGRSGKVALGDVMLDDPERENAKTQEHEQSASVAGFPVEKVPADWPYFGAAELEEVTFRYSAQLSPALSSCSLRLPAGKALLLCGPESCGKSSLLRQLLRLHVPEAGRVLVDNVDLRCVGLATLRGRVAVVPQEVMLYRGTWRQNLDPMDEFNEEDLQLVLRLTRLENWMLHHSCRLDDEVDAKAGPLVALCRAMLRLVRKRSKLMLLDAVTCRLAPAFDADLTAILLQYCRRGGIAVLQTSRRVQQAPLYDEVAAMSNGRILEQGTAKKLWVKDGALRRMAKEQGLDSNRMTKPDAVSARLASVWGWEVSPQEEAAWQDEFAVAMKKVKGDKDRRASK